MEIGRLTDVDRDLVVSRIPKRVRKMLKSSQTYVAGGFIRSTIAGERVSDIDVFGPSKETLETQAGLLAHDIKGKLHVTANALTVLAHSRTTAQFITRWVFDNPEDLIKSFDFTVCQAVVWWQDKEWVSRCSTDFYPDLASRRLVYTHPIRNEDAGGSMLRMRKFLKRGYNIRVDSMAGVIARLVNKLRDDVMGDEETCSTVIAGLLREVDPLINIDET